MRTFNGYDGYNDPSLHRRRVRQGIIIVVLLLVTFAGVVWMLHLWETWSDPEIDSDPIVTRATTRARGGALYDLREDMETILIIGLDKYEADIDDTADSYRNFQQADFLLLMMIDRGEKKCQALHINRDTMSKVQVLGITGDVAGVQVEQLALAHTYGTGREDSCRNTVRAVSTFLHETPIDHYVAVTMDAVAILNDAVGGVTVEVRDDFSKVDPTLVKGQTVTLQGAQALTYVRARSGMEEQTNINRMSRQRQYMSALQEKLTEKIRGDSGFSLDTVMKLSGYMSSDCPVNHLAAVADTVAEYGFSGILTIDGEAVEGEQFMEFYADDEKLQAQILDLFYLPVDDHS
ncbi:MAG: LCP family protein [Clostridia bacterium]|nr:LCP family protein [Clostridia bacterium]